MDRQFDAFAAVEPRDHFTVFRAPPDARHVAENNIASLLVAYDDAPDFVHRAELVEHADHVAGVLVVEAAAGLVEILLTQDVRDLGDRDAQLGQALLVDLDANLLFSAAEHLDGRHAFRRFETLLEFLFGQVAQLAQAQVAEDLHPHDRIMRGIEAQHDGLLGIFGKR